MPPLQSRSHKFHEESGQSDSSMNVSLAPLSAFGRAESYLQHLLTGLSNAATLQNKHVTFRSHVSTVLKWYVLLDVLSLVLAFLASWFLASQLNAVLYHRPLYNPETHEDVRRMVQCGLISLGVLFKFELEGHYILRMPFWLELKKILYILMLALAFDGFLQFAGKADFSRCSFFLNWGFAALFVVGSRNLFRHLLAKGKGWHTPVLLVGHGVAAEEAHAALRAEKGLGFYIQSQVHNLSEAFEASGSSWENLCVARGVEYVLIALDAKDLHEAEEPVAQLMRENIPFSVVPPLRSMSVLGMVPQHFFNHDVMFLTRQCGLEHRSLQIIKRVFDLLVSTVALALLSPLFLILILLIKRDGGDVFFAQTRLGLLGKPFKCFKFRTMFPNSDVLLRRHLKDNLAAREEWARDRKLRHDPRVTKVGQFLRRTSLDELPQLLNVLRGDMSLVGPRPIVADEVPLYGQDIAHYYHVRPGITGIWQVSGRSDVSYPKRVRMDSWYVRNWSLWHDLAILCKTIPALLNRKGAY